MARFINRIKGRKGSLTVEAAMALPLFICVVLSIAFIMRLVHVHSIVQHAITETANEMATYSYIYSVTGLQRAHDDLKAGLDNRKKTFEGHFGEIVNAYSSFSTSKDKLEDAKDDLLSGNIDQASIDNIKTTIETHKEDINKVKDVLKEAGTDPKKEFISMLCMFADPAFEDLKTALADPVIRFFSKKYFRTQSIKDENKRLLAFQVEGGFNGLDFSESKIFKDKKTIEIIVRYKVNTILPFNFLPDIYMIQRASVRAWLDGDDNSDEGENTSDTDSSSDKASQNSVWALSPIERGRRIQQLEGRNLPANFPVITKSDDSGNVAKITSIDLMDPTYLKPRGLESKVRSLMNEVADFESGTYNGININVKSKTLVLVVPEGTLSQEHKNLIQAIEGDYNKDGQNIKIEIKEAYGKRVEEGSESQQVNTGTDK